MDSPEVNNDDDWEEGSLPAVPSIPFFTQQDFKTVIPTPRNSRIDSHQPGSLSSQQAADGLPIRPGGPSKAFNVDRAPNVYRPQIGGISGRSRGIIARQLEDLGTRVLNAAEESFHRKEPHNGDYTFSHSWKDLLFDWTRAGGVEELKRMSSLTGSFIVIAPENDALAQIWGNPDQVASARAELFQFEKSAREKITERKEATGNWPKTRALDARKEHRNERKAQVDEFVEQQRKLGLSAEFAFEYWLLWPSGELAYEEINPKSIEELKKNYWCTVDYNPLTSYVRIMSNKERELLQFVQRVVNLVKEKVAALNQVIKANLLQPPSTSGYKDSVKLEKNHLRLATPKLHGNALPEAEIENWEQLLRDERRSNRRKVGNALEKCLKSLQFSEKHVRLRMNFGKLAFKRYQLPSDGGDLYKFDDFCETVANDRTVLEILSLPCGPGTNKIVDNCASHPLFVEPVEIFAAHFDFKQPEQTTILRLECEFRWKKQEQRELEVGQQRWLEFTPGSESSLLELNMLDFEKPEWQMSLDAAAIPDNKMIGRQMASFHDSVSFKETTDGLKSKPQRRARFASGYAALVCVTEHTTMRYQVKDTDGVFELTRKDEYVQPRYPGKPFDPVSSMAATYYYPEWDNLLAEYAYIEPGGQVSWAASLSTFFPDRVGAIGRPKGFKNFTEELGAIQDALSSGATQANNPPDVSALNEISNSIGDPSG